MRRLHEQHTRPIFGRPMTCDDVQYVCKNTSTGSKLRNFYMHFVVEHFGSPAKLLGSSTDWDTLLQNQPEIRILLLDKFRKSIFLPTHVESIDEYLEPSNSPSILPSQQKSELTQLPIGAKTAEAPIFNFGEKPAGKPREPFQLASRTKNYEGAAVKFGWEIGEITDKSTTPSIKGFQPKQDSPSELEAEPAQGHGNQCITSVGNSEDKSPETRKGKEPIKEAVHDNKDPGLGEAST
ncbi:sdr family [Fusarium acutatum]|uniref:Sdr family n=1 Tax=Fusarium acutatum TaxID=78861 RepID=A0A8H4JQJ3_9HYPO|nr:sdr family [Fusarium acutatum]